MSTKPKKFRRDKTAKVNSIIEATIELIKEQGYSGFSVDEIPNRANLSIGTVYRYFPNGRSDILYEILHRNAKTLLELITQEEISEGTFREFWKNIITSVLRGHREGLFSLTATEYSLWTNPQYDKVAEPVSSYFIQKLVNQTSGIETFTSLTKEEFISRLHIAVGIANMLVRRHIIKPMFKSDQSLVKYLTEVCLLTFRMD